MDEIATAIAEVYLPLLGLLGHLLLKPVFGIMAIPALFKRGVEKLDATFEYWMSI